MNQLQKILASGLQFFVVGDKLRIKGDAATIESLKPLLIAHKPEIIAALETDQPERNEKPENGLNHASAKTNAIPARPEHVTQDQLTEIIQAAVNLAEKFKADRRGADLEEIEKAFNTVEHAERTGSESDFNYALMELEALTREYSEGEERRAA